MVYGSSGICVVKEIASLDMSGSGQVQEYYVLVPVQGANSKSYIPTNNEHIILRPVLTKDEALSLIDDIPEIEQIDEVNDKIREEQYKIYAKRCDCRSWIAILKTVYRRREERLNQGKKITVTDDRYMKLAQDNLYGELGFVMGKNRDDMEELIKDKWVGLSEC